MPVILADVQAPAKILIAHQGTIPNYRIPFFSLLEKLRPDHWTFQVVPTDPEAKYPFPTNCAALRRLPFNLRWQNLTLAARQADVLVLDTHLRNIGYLVAASFRKKSCPLILWGHTHNMNQQGGSRTRSINSRLKSAHLRSCDMFFAYTPSQAHRARTIGLKSPQIQVLNNTVDIEAARSRYLTLAVQRDAIRQALGCAADDIVLLIVGRLLPERRISFLSETFRHLDSHKTFKLIVIGDGPESAMVRQLQNDYPEQVTATGAISDADLLSRYYTAADTFIMPGAIGLAPLEAICHDLPVIGFELPTHGPEFEYLSSNNSHILPASTTPLQFAEHLKQWTLQTGYRSSFPNAYASISHLSLQTMVENFITGVNCALARQNPSGANPPCTASRSL